VRLIASTRIKARTQHACHLCRLPIEPGERYVRESYAEDGVYSLATHIECDEECAAVAERERCAAGWPHEDQEFQEGALADDMREAEADQVTGLEWQRWYRSRLAKSEQEGR
jgi:hypothetical protein